MTLVFGQDDEVAAWAAEQLGYVPMVKPFVAIGVRDKSGAYSGALIFNGFSGRDIELTVVGRGAITRESFDAFASYVFGQLRCARVSAVISQQNVRALDVAEKFGFRREGVARKKFEDSDAVLLGLLKEEYRYGRR
jgi:hypothetical protein